VSSARCCYVQRLALSGKQDAVHFALMPSGLAGVLLSMANCYLASHAFAGTTPSPNAHPCNMLQGRLVCHSF
jgi:hypothetical protein